jgi:hypothetical protein
MISPIEMLMKGLDEYQPDWYITYANQREMDDCIRACTDGRSGTVQGKTKLRLAVATRLIEVVRAAMGAGLVEYVLPKDEVALSQASTRS